MIDPFIDGVETREDRTISDSTDPITGQDNIIDPVRKGEVQVNWSAGWTTAGVAKAHNRYRARTCETKTPATFSCSQKPQSPLDSEMLLPKRALASSKRTKSLLVSAWRSRSYHHWATKASSCDLVADPRESICGA